MIATRQSPFQLRSVIDHTMTDITRIHQVTLMPRKQICVYRTGTHHTQSTCAGLGYWRGIYPSYNYNTNGAIQAGILSLQDYTPQMIWVIRIA